MRTETVSRARNGPADQAFRSRTGSARRTPVFVVCSPRPRVGRTLLARLLVEYFALDARPVSAFDVNPGDPVLHDFLPDYVRKATIADTRDQMALFDRLIAPDSVPKIVDLAHGLFDPFFELVSQIGFAAESHARLIDLVLLFVTDTHRLSVDAYGRLGRHFPATMLVPVHNESVTRAFYADSFPATGESPLRLPRLSPVLNTVINKKGFSFAHFLQKPVSHPTEIHDFVHASFVGFRELELRLLMADFRQLFRNA